MTAARPNFIQEMLNDLYSKGYVISDLLAQSLSICIGLFFLDRETIRKLQRDPIRQETFEKAVCGCLAETDRQAAWSYRGFSQIRLPEDAYRELLQFWLRACADRGLFGYSDSRFCDFIEGSLYQEFINICRPAAVVPVWLVQFAIALLPHGGSTFYDGAAGAGGTALGIAQDRQEKGIPLQIQTIEADPLLFHFSVLRAKMRGFSFQQTNQDCLQFESPRAALTDHPKADRSIMFPPLRRGKGLRISDEVSCGSDWAYAYHQLRSLNEGGTGVCWVPNGALFNARNQAFRKYLLDQNVINAVICLPRNLTSGMASPLSLVVFHKGRRENDAIQMAYLPDTVGMQVEFDSEGKIRDWTEQVLDHLKKNSRMVLRSKLDAVSLSSPQYLSEPPVRRKSAAVPLKPPVTDREDDRKKGVLSLGEAVQVYRGINVAGLTRCEGGGKVLRLSDVQDGRICIEGVAGYDLSARKNLERYRIQKGDILISCKGQAVKLCLVPEDTQLFLSHDFLGLRADRAKADPRYLLYYLQSPVGQQAIRRIQKGSSIFMIRAIDLEAMPFRYIPLAMQTQCASELYGADKLIAEQIAALQASKQRAYERFYQKIGLEDDL